MPALPRYQHRTSTSPSRPALRLVPDPAGGFAAQLAVLDRAARMLGRGFVPPGITPPTQLAGKFRARLLGNSLRELDLILNRLADAASGGGTGPDQTSGWPQQRNTANKVRALLAGRSHAEADLARLRALWRTRGCLLHCNGVVRSGDEPGCDTLTLGWTAGQRHGPLLRIAVGERIEVSAASLHETGEFYLRLAECLREVAELRSGA